MSEANHARRGLAQSFVWTRGHHVRQRRDREWVPGHWDRHSDHYDWHDGEWHPHR